MAKSYSVTLLLWATLGLVGAHHFYLGRDRHGTVHLLTYGGFLLGWLYDLRNLRSYVRWANFDREFKQEYLERVKANDKPGDTLMKNISGTILCELGAILLSMAVPAYLTSNAAFTNYVMPILTALMIAFVVYYLGNIGETEGTFQSALKGALFVVPYYYYSPDASAIWCVIASKHTFTKRYRPRPEHKANFCIRFVRCALVVGLIGGLLASFVVYNCQVESDEGDTASCVDSVRHFFNSPAWTNFKDTLIDLRNYTRHYGWRSLWSEIVKAFDMTGTDNAAKVLGVSKSASEEEIKAVYKKLARQYHPDKVKDPEQRVVAQERFMEIQRAYELLSETKAKRSKHNKKYRTDDKIEL